MVATARCISRFCAEFPIAPDIETQLLGEALVSRGEWRKERGHGNDERGHRHKAVLGGCDTGEEKYLHLLSGMVGTKYVILSSSAVPNRAKRTWLLTLP